MNVSLTKAVLQRLPDLSVHVLVARAIRLDVLQYFQVIPPVLDPDAVENLLVQWRAQWRDFPGPWQGQGALAQLVRMVMNQQFQSTLPMVDMANYAALLALCPVSGFDMAALHGSLTLELAQSADEACQPALFPGEPVWRDGRQQLVTRRLNAWQSPEHQLSEHSANIVFISEQPHRAMPAPGRAFHYLQATLTPLCDSLQYTVLDARQLELAC
ncbi:hypothetical protein [Paludibacterium sp. B53371]|uniref:hypothetical protein n=1 Tax=Paludibacterium sp. B53371 TaxID=2806263 RepID=UPI001C058B6F|nr:hypothetical protein [Paludibacterium sp. B53371]